MVMKLTPAILGLFPFYQFLIKFLKRSCMIDWNVFFYKHNILYESQYEFKEEHSTEHAILDIVNKIQKNMDRGMFSCGIFTDLQKAFNTVDHCILLQKLYYYGPRGIINDWFCSYLPGTIQTTQIGPHISKKEKTLFGVP